MDTITEATRYIDNAKELLRDKAQKEDKYYTDAKYVKMAGNTAYSGVLLALDGLLGVKKKGRKSVEWYKEELGKMDKSLFIIFFKISIAHFEYQFYSFKLLTNTNIPLMDFC